MSPGAVRAGGDPLAALSSRLPALPPSCGPVRLVGVDGHAGSGKTTLAGRLAAALGGAPVVHLDDLACHGSFFGWTGRLFREVLTPLSRGRVARFRVYDWERRAFDRTAVIPPAPVVLVEGVGAGRRALRSLLAYLVWVDVEPGEAWARGMRRDGPALGGFWRQWRAAELRHFADDPSKPFADMLIRARGDSYAARTPGR